MTSNPETTGENGQPVPGIGTTLLRIVVVFRVVGAVWLTSLALITMFRSEYDTGSAANTAIIWSTIAIALIWTGVTVFLAYKRGRLLRSWGFLMIDLALAAWVATAPGLVSTEVFFAGGWPISSPFLVATMRGLTATIAPALFVALASAAGVASLNPRVLEVLALNSVSPLVVAWGFGIIKEQDAARREAQEALADERTKRARADERAEVAAHLHDSVLQTLALIQRKAPENREVTRLARRQERELRAWLNGGTAVAAGNTVSAAVIRAAEDVEDEYDVTVEVSTAGDRILDERATGVVLAAREAMTNAARFAGVDRIFVLAESRGDDLRVVVRDQGNGFDPDEVSDDRRGVRESIVGRLERLGGTARVRSNIGEGTEVQLSIGASEWR